jgi:hypothetical protein
MPGSSSPAPAILNAARLFELAGYQSNGDYALLSSA